MDMEQIVCEIIANAGDCRSSCLCAMQAAADHDYAQVHALIEEAKKALYLAHEAHANLLTLEARGELTEVSLLMVHASNHLSAAETIHDLVESLIILLEGKEYV